MSVVMESVGRAGRNLLLGFPLSGRSSGGWEDYDSDTRLSGSK